VLLMPPPDGAEALDAPDAPPPPLVHAEAELGDVRLHYVIAGEGPAVVLLHGWPQTWYMWRHVIPGLARRLRVIAPDLRGLGDSSRPEGGYDKKTVAGDVWRLVHGVLGERSLFVVGHDWGGPVAFALAAQHRDAVRRLAILDVPVPGDGTPVFYDNRWHHGLHWEPGLAEALTAGREDVYLGFFYRTWGERPDAISPEAQAEYLRAYRQPGAMRAGFEYYRAMRQDIIDNEAFLAQGKLPMPVLCWGGAGARGRGMRAIDSWRRVASDVRGGVVQGCGHWIAEERPQWVVEQLLAFFGEAQAPG
jgi:pimeloyl-ACP methyl ester carboxylesterase